MPCFSFICFASLGRPSWCPCWAKWPCSTLQSSPLQSILWVHTKICHTFLSVWHKTGDPNFLMEREGLCVWWGCGWWDYEGHVFHLRLYVPLITGGTLVKNLLADAGDLRDTGLIPGLERYPGEGNGSPFRYSCLENSIDRGAWWATIHGVAKSRTWLSTHTKKHHNFAHVPRLPLNLRIFWSLHPPFAGSEDPGTP